MAYRVILAFVLSLLVILAYDYFFVRKQQPRQQPPQQFQKKVERIENHPKPPKVPVPQRAAKTDCGRDIIVSTSLYQATFCENGGYLKAFSLKKYREGVDPDSPPKRIILAKDAQPLSLRFLNTKLNKVSYSCSKDRLEVKGGKAQLCFIISSPSLLIKKIYTFYPDKYYFDLNIILENKGKDIFKDSLTLSLANRWPQGRRYDFRGAIFFLNDRFKSLKQKKIKDGDFFVGRIKWLGLSDKYFMTTIVNKAFERASFVLKTHSEKLSCEFLTPPITLKQGEERAIPFLVYIGPKEIDRLKALGLNLDKAVNFGFFDSISKILLYVLKWFYKFTHNYGIAIIVLTFIIKILFWPLTHQSYKSMKDMQRLQPQIAKIRQRYKNDKVRMNQEIMNLYRTYKVNPMGGCLPIILQIPVFFALYYVLIYAIELRHAPFITYFPFTKKIWLADLSAKDPYYITPILMGISMVAQQKLTPSSVNPTQEKLMLFMPIFFTIIFLNFPSGLVIYWLVNNVLSIIQQVYINRRFK